jgi:hypothetical protein
VTKRVTRLHWNETHLDRPLAVAARSAGFQSSVEFVMLANRKPFILSLCDRTIESQQQPAAKRLSAEPVNPPVVGLHPDALANWDLEFIPVPHPRLYEPA